jgi:hypothetical protein
MGYTAGAAGIAVSPRGLGAVFIMPLVACSRVKSITDGRLPPALSCSPGQVTPWPSSRCRFRNGLWFGPVIVSGAASGLVFVPRSTLAMSTLRNEQIGNASGLYNLLRNIGGSIGISVSNTLVLAIPKRIAWIWPVISPPTGFCVTALLSPTACRCTTLGRALRDFAQMPCWQTDRSSRRRFIPAWTFCATRLLFACTALPLCSRFAASSSKRRADWRALTKEQMPEEIKKRNLVNARASTGGHQRRCV